MQNKPEYPGYLLRNGSSGEQVKLIQEYLSKLSIIYPSIPTITVDGEFGNATENAVKAFQRLMGLKEDGIVGPNTWNSLTDLCFGPISTVQSGLMKEPYYNSELGSYVFSENNIPDNKAGNDIYLTGSWLRHMKSCDNLSMNNTDLYKDIYNKTDDLESSKMPYTPQAVPVENYSNELNYQPAPYATYQSQKDAIEFDSTIDLYNYEKPSQPHEKPCQSKEISIQTHEYKPVQPPVTQIIPPPCHTVNKSLTHNMQKAQCEPSYPAASKMTEPIPQYNPYGYRHNSNTTGYGSCGQTSTAPKYNQSGYEYNSNVTGYGSYGQTPAVPQYNPCDGYEYNSNVTGYSSYVQTPAVPRYNPCGYGYNPNLTGYGIYGRTSAVPQYNRSLPFNTSGINTKESIFYILLLRLIYMSCRCMC